MDKTREDFINATGTEPIQDDLERVNCNKAGFVGHTQCGWCEIHNKPKFMCVECVKARVKV